MLPRDHSHRRTVGNTESPGVAPRSTEMWYGNSMGLETVLRGAGLIALVDVDSYRGFVAKKCTFDRLAAHLVSEMQARHAVAWGLNGSSAEYVVRVTDRWLSPEAYEEIVIPLHIAQGGAYLVDYDALSRAATNQKAAIVVRDRERHITLPAGTYRCRVIRLRSEEH